MTNPQEGKRHGGNDICGLGKRIKADGFTQSRSTSLSWSLASTSSLPSTSVSVFPVVVTLLRSSMLIPMVILRDIDSDPMEIGGLEDTTKRSPRFLRILHHNDANLRNSAVRQAISKALIAYNQKYETLPRRRKKDNDDENDEPPEDEMMTD